MAEYASFKTRNYPTTVAHRGREVELGVWVRGWVALGLLASFPLAIVILAVMCHGVHS